MSSGATVAQQAESQSDADDFSRVMVVVAHPDDAEFSCAGSVAKFARG